MTPRTSARLAAILVLVLGGAGSAAASAPQAPAAPASIAGHWAGSIELPGAKLELDVDFAPAGSGWTGDVSIPMQKAKDLPLTKIALKGAEVSFVIQGIPGEPTFQGRVSADGKTIAGTMAQGGQSFPFTLSREPDPVERARAALTGFDTVVEDALKALHVPGAAVAVVRDDTVVLAKGFGFKDLEKKLPVTPDTIFAIGSSSKAFTVFALGKLVDEGRMDWDAPVRSYIPWFRLYDEAAGERLTPRDLVTHRSGLPRHDLVWYNNATDSREALVRRLAYLPPSAGLRERWQYNNMMFLTAGYLLETLTGKSWEDSVRSLVFEPLGMATANFSVKDSQASPDYALPYRWADGALKRIPFRDITNIGPAGSINADVREMSHWASVHLNDGKWAGRQLVNASTVVDMHTPRMPTGGTSTEPEIQAESYAMGWFADVYRGHARVHHGGNIDGFSALVAFFPQDRLGFVVLTNLNGTPLPELLVRAAADRVLGLEPKDWAADAAKRMKLQEDAGKAAEAKGATRRVPNTKPAHPLADYAGVYENPGYGELRVDAKAGALAMTFNGIATPLEHWHYETFSGGKSDDPTFQDFKLTFRADANGRVAAVEGLFEPTLPEEVFRKKPDPRYSDPAFLKAFAGTYEMTGQKVTFTIRGKGLVASLAGQPDMDLVPDLGGEFTLKQVKAVAIKFLTDAAGAVTGAELIQGGAVFDMKRLKD